ncbi:hypothetical protein [Oceanicella actignis]|uniref:Formate dehydrogenase region TAT target n=1 Tax=Oceanicella actignis TaxID=1189325 RepID=A0A1M7TV11_9RHOB|nr:hypothetical protein [Oceanicella actignis]TYO90469.1 secreted protein [Oceanicella actignis]SES79490.1 formate dehydrogenase region TAT target [Oceanicella actignis]SHN74551.1 formate dehydrogenase region TAT target [Oceanicella actignis]
MSKKDAAATRRDFLKLAGAAAPAAAAAVVAPAAAKAAAPAKAPAGLRRTEHVEKYLRSARF